MTIATTAAWEPTVDRVLTQALRKLGVLHASHAASADALAYGREALAAWMQALIARGIPMNIVEWTVQTLTPSDRDYDVNSDAESVDQGGFVTDANGLDFPVELITAADYNRISDKSVEGQPFQYYPQKSAAAHVLYLYLVPTVSYVTFTYPRIRRPRDVETGSNTLDLPRTLMKPAVSAMVYEYAGHYKRPIETIDKLRDHADEDLDIALGNENPHGDLQFTVPTIFSRY